MVVVCSDELFWQKFAVFVNIIAILLLCRRQEVREREKEHGKDETEEEDPQATGPSSGQQ